MAGPLPAPVRLAVQRGSRTFSAFTTGQKVVTVVAILGVVVGGFLFSSWASQATYSPLFSNLAPTDASAMVDKLTAAKVPYQLTDGGGTILVPQDKVYAERLQMSAAGLPAGQQSGYSLLDKQGITTSQFQQQVTYQRALAGELEKTIEAINGVSTAAVQLAIPQQDVFAADSQKPTASVLVATQPGVTLSSQQVQAVVHLVASSVVGMSPDDVTVADAAGHVLAAPGQSILAGAGSDAQAQQTNAFDTQLSQSVQQMLDQVVGPGHAVVNVSAALDFDQTQTTSETFQAQPSTPPLSSVTTQEAYKGTGTAVGGVLGPDNIQVPSGGGGASTYSKSSTTVDNAVGKITQVRQSAPGAVRRLGVAVLLDAHTAASVDLTQIQDLVSSAVGLDPTRGDTIKVSKMPFDQTAAKQAKAAIDAARSAQQQAGLFSLVKTAGLVLLLLLVLLAAFLSARRRRPAALSDQDLATLGLLERQLQPAIDVIAPPALDGGGAEVPALLPGHPQLTDRSGVTAARSEIADLVSRQPDEVAQLLRGWLADRRA
jgi:flagellar M-ring protein FliF